jgi:hypothetical protein
MHAQAPTAHAVKCDSCRKTVTLVLQSATPAETAWRWFDCPFCHKANFLRVPGHIMGVKAEQEV